jgi:hypothetical protein
LWTRLTKCCSFVLLATPCWEPFFFTLQQQPPHTPRKTPSCLSSCPWYSTRTRSEEEHGPHLSLGQGPPRPSSDSAHGATQPWYDPLPCEFRLFRLTRATSLDSEPLKQERLGSNSSGLALPRRRQPTPSLPTTTSSAGMMWGPCSPPLPMTMFLEFQNRNQSLSLVSAWRALTVVVTW